MRAYPEKVGRNSKTWRTLCSPSFNNLNHTYVQEQMGRMYSLGEVNFIQGMLDFCNCKNSVGLKPIAVRLRQTLSDARSQALPGNVFLAALPPVQSMAFGQRNEYDLTN